MERRRSSILPSSKSQASGTCHVRQAPADDPQLLNRQSLNSSTLILLCSLLSFLLVPLALEAQLQSAGSGSGQSIRLGDAVMVPGTDEALVPVYLTSEVEIQTWQMGLEYDELLLNLVEVEFTGTESETLNPILLPTLSAASIVGFEVVYPGPDYLPSGDGILAALLRFEWIGAPPIPSPSGLAIPIDVVDLETLPISMTSTGGAVIVPETQSGSVVIHDYPLILVEETTATLVDSEILIPVRAWTSGPSSTFMMGLEYDELLMTQFIVNGSDLDSMTSGDWSLSTEITANGTIVTIETPVTLPALNGETLGFLRVDRPGNQPGEPGWGPWLIDLNPLQCQIDGNPVSYLEPGSVTWISHFIRGDANLDSALNIADAETILGACYMGKPVDCEDAADTNDDGALDVSDVVTVLQFLFSGSPTPPAPFPDAGSDPTGDLLNCD